MKASEAPAFLKRAVPTRAKLKTARKRSKARPERFAGDTGTPEIKLRQKVLIEARQRSLKGEPTVVGARVEAQFPHDRYRVRNQLDPANAWRNDRLWEAAERLRKDFDASGLGPKLCSSFMPRVTGSSGTLGSDKQMDAQKRYKKSMNAISMTLRSPLFYIVIAGEAASDWAARNAIAKDAGLAILRLSLAELAHFYGMIKMSGVQKEPA